MANNIEVISSIRVDEINIVNIESYMKDAQKDFQCRGQAKFEAYPYDDIILFTENICKKCIYEINAIMGKCLMGDFEELFVEI